MLAYSVLRTLCLALAAGTKRKVGKLGKVQRCSDFKVTDGVMALHVGLSPHSTSRHHGHLSLLVL